METETDVGELSNAYLHEGGGKGVDSDLGTLGLHFPDIAVSN